LTVGLPLDLTLAFDNTIDLTMFYLTLAPNIDLIILGDLTLDLTPALDLTLDLVILDLTLNFTLDLTTSA
jgi:hypothetical protein